MYSIASVIARLMTRAKLVAVKGFWIKAAIPVALKASNRFDLVVTTTKNHTCVGADRTNLTKGFFATHDRHGHIQENRDDLGGVLSEHIKAYLPILRN